MEKVTKNMVWCGAGPYGVGWCGAMEVEIHLQVPMDPSPGHAPFRALAKEIALAIATSSDSPTS